MRSSKSRSRSKSNRPRSMGNIVNRVFDSSGPEGKVRGTPQQIIDKYLLLARDAQLSNDRVAAENFLQHAEHYTRMLGEAQRELAAEQEARRPQQGQGHGTNGHHGQGGGGGQQQDRFQPGRGREERDENAGAERGPDAGAAAVIEFDDAPGGDSGLVETPESRQAPKPRPDRAAHTDAAGPAPAPEAKGPRGPRRRPEPKPAAPADTPVPAQNQAPDPAAAGTAEKPARAPRTRGPRKPRAEKSADTPGAGAPDHEPPASAAE